MAKQKVSTPFYGNVAMMNGREVYTSFGHDLPKMIADAEGLYHGIIRIEEAHTGKPPVWVRKDE